MTVQVATKKSWKRTEAVVSALKWCR
jgi:hypothetical protein